MVSVHEQAASSETNAQSTDVLSETRVRLCCIERKRPNRVRDGDAACYLQLQVLSRDTVTIEKSRLLEFVDHDLTGRIMSCCIRSLVSEASLFALVTQALSV